MSLKLSMQKALGIEGEEEKEEEFLLSKITELVENQSTDELQEKADMADKLEADNSKLKEEIVALSTQKKEVDPELLDVLMEATDEKMNALVQRGQITPNVQVKLSALARNAEGKPNALMLSKQVSGRSKSLMSEVIEILSENDITELSEKTEAQAVMLGRKNPNGDTELSDEEKQTFAASRAGAVQGIRK